MDKETQVAFYRRADASRFVNRVENPFIARKERALARRLAALAGTDTPAVLEVGCGEGGNLHYLSREIPGASLVGMDFSFEKAVYLGAAVPGAGAVCGDATRLPFASASFDLVLCRDLLHHVNWDRDGVIAEALRVTREGGAVAVLETTGTALINRLFYSLYPAERGIRDSNPETLLALGQRHGECHLQKVEASFLVRAMAFVLGPPRGVFGPLVSGLYGLGSAWEGAVRKWLPERRWIYNMVIIRHAVRSPGAASPRPERPGGPA